MASRHHRAGSVAGAGALLMDHKDPCRVISSAVSSFLHSRLADRPQRLRHKDQCAERLAAGAADSDARYSEQAILANLDWGIDALEDAISSSNPEAKLARLDHAERMLQVAAMLDPAGATAGVPNSYLSAWAHLNLALLHSLRGPGPKHEPRAAAIHALEMFDVDPFFARIDFAPELWESLFLPHMASIVAWYSETRHQIVMDTIPDSSDLSLTVDFGDQLFNESVILSLRPDQAEKLRDLERQYAESLDDNTRMFAKYYKDMLNGGEQSAGRKGTVPPLPPIAEPPVTPLHELSRSIPDFVKFGPILPKSAGFSPSFRERDDLNDAGGAPSPSSRTSANSTSLQQEEETDTKGSLHEEDEEINCVGSDSELTSQKVNSNIGQRNSTMTALDKKSVPNIRSPKRKDQSRSFRGHSPLDSSRKSFSKVPSTKQVAPHSSEAEQFLCLFSSRYTSPPSTRSSVASSNTAAADVSPPKIAKESLTPLSFISNRSKSSLTSPGNDIALNSDHQVEEQRNRRNSFSGMQKSTHRIDKDYASNVNFHTESEEEVSQSSYLLLSERLTPRTRPPKDFVCPITGQLFNDPVTLETGQTFERKAIQEWLKRGHTTCPITRQLLSSTVLPKTNYVLKRLITSWIEQNPDLAQEFSYPETPNASPSPVSEREFHADSPNVANIDSPLPKSGTKAIRRQRSKRFSKTGDPTSPTGVVSQVTSEAIVNELKQHSSSLCTSENLQECEVAVLPIAKIWKDSKTDRGIHSFLSQPTIVSGFVEVLSASINREALRASIYILSELVFTDESVGETLISIDSDFDCMAGLILNGLAEAAVLLYQLRPTFSKVSNHNLIPSLVQVIMSKCEQLDDFQLILEPKDAAIALLDQILVGGDENDRSLNAFSVISTGGLPALIRCLDRTDRRLPIVSILLSCMRADTRCRNLIASRAELGPVLELFHAGNDQTRSICVDFLAELICLNRRAFCNKILQIIKDEGAFSTMHSFLVYLQMAPMDQQTIVASLLLQLDLLVEPRKMSIYREEAIEAILEALQRKDFPVSQTIALETLSSLSGRLTSSGKPLTEAWLLKTAGVDQPYKTLMLEEKMRMLDDAPTEALEEEEKAMTSWEKRVAYVLCNHEKGAIFKALEECFKSNSLEMAKSCLVIATWLTHMLSTLPDTGIRAIASQCLLDQFINILLSSRNLEDKILATLALNTFIHDPDAVKGLGLYVKRIYKPLKKLKRCSGVVTDTLRAIKNLPSVDATEFWSCTDLFGMDLSSNGEVLSLVHSRSRLFSSHSDGTIKVWDAGNKSLKIIQEVHEHSKSVTCLNVSSSGDKLYSGSHDKTIRIWAVEPEEIHCVKVHDVKEPVHCFTTNNKLLCFSSQGAGAKVFNWKGVPKHVSFNRNVKCLAMTEEYLYCGCTGYNIQEVDLSKCTSATFFSGTKKLLAKQSIYAIYIQDGDLFVGGSSVDGIAGKAFSLSTKAITGAFSTGFDIHYIYANNDYVFTGTKCGLIEVWTREQITKVASIKLSGGPNSKVTALTSDSDGELLFAGSTDGKIQVRIISSCVGFTHSNL